MDNTQKGHRLLLRTHFFLAIILLIHSVLFLIYWFAVPDFRMEVDQLISARIGWELPYSIIFMVLTALIFLWSLVRVVKFGFALRQENWKPTIKNWLFFAIWLLFLVLFYGSFWLILRANVGQRGVILHLLNIIRLFSDALILLIVAIILWRLIKWVEAKFVNDTRKWPLRVAVILALILLIGAWLVPVLFPPNWAYRGALPTKPAVIADGGAAMLAPENTLAAIELAGANDAFGFETTVRISSDGVPFLMRDETFARTTNIAEVYPGRADDLASSFDLEDIKNLNAGLWFIQTDPYDTIEDGKISQTQLSINQGQRIPTLAEALEFVADQEMIVLLHLIRPPEDHPYYDEFFDIVLSICQESDLNDDIWLELEENQIQISQTESPQITRVLSVSSQEKPQASEVLARGYEIIHTDTGVREKTIRELRDEGLGVNVYRINQSWLFSQFWLSGVTSISTTNIQTFSVLEKPFINLPFTSYLLIWSLFGIVLGIWLASSFPLPERKAKLEEEVPIPAVPEIEGEPQIPPLSPETSPVAPEPAETQFEAESPVEDLEEPVETIESGQPVEPVQPIESFEPIETVEQVESGEDLPVQEDVADTEVIEETGMEADGQEIHKEEWTDLTEEEPSVEEVEEISPSEEVKEVIQTIDAESSEPELEDDQNKSGLDEDQDTVQTDQT